MGIQKGIVEAQALKADAEKRAAEMEARLATIGEEIEKFRVQAHAEMEQEGRRITEETARQMARLKQQAEHEIETAAKLARRELKSVRREAVARSGRAAHPRPAWTRRPKPVWWRISSRIWGRRETK